MWERYCYARGWCTLKLQINKEPIYYHYIGVPRHMGRSQKTHYTKGREIILSKELGKITL